MDQSILSQLHCDGDMNYVFSKVHELDAAKSSAQGLLDKDIVSM